MRDTKIVWLIDDDAITNFVNQELILGWNYTDTIEIFEDAQEALITLESVTDTAQKPDLIFLDLNMPNMDGFQFLEEYNSFLATVTSNITVVVLSSSKNSEDVSRVKRLGIRNYLIKPITEQKLQPFFK